MSKNNNTLHINGKKYDARTGAPLEHGSRTPKAHSEAVLRRTKASHVHAHAPKTSRTLMRHVLKKPKPQASAHATKSSSAISNHPHAVSPKKSVKHISPHRLERANHVAQSGLISHFRPISPTPYQVVEPLQHAPQPFDPRPTQPAPKKQHPKGTADLLENALKHATSHQQPAPKHPKRSRKHLASIGGAVALVAIVLGITIYQNASDLRLQMASSKAGFEVRMPAHPPSGYRVGELTYSPGLVTTRFQSNSDDREYSITQRKTQWDDAALRDMFVVTKDPGYTSIDSNGQTLYIYDKTNITWVKNGIWTTIASNGALSERQLVQLASTL